MFLNGLSLTKIKIRKAQKLPNKGARGTLSGSLVPKKVLVFPVEENRQVPLVATRPLMTMARRRQDEKKKWARYKDRIRNSALFEDHKAFGERKWHRNCTKSTAQEKTQLLMTFRVV